jgi:MarR-like DNA-binding transcriptional regulator SgrR of sgrS sRNA
MTSDQRDFETELRRLCERLASTPTVTADEVRELAETGRRNLRLLLQRSEDEER